ncbi:MAG: InlB B-repeat-containing protein [Candidatus Pacebacteria bacterium]|nr:InlB B-repeat-containing protein [Candidatus Paceibacterota bacterium]
MIKFNKLFLILSILFFSFFLSSSSALAGSATGSVTIDVYASCTTGPAGYTKCSDENQTCSFSGEANVAFGCNSSFNYKDSTDSIACNNTTFGGDPAPGVFKACFYKPYVMPTSTVPTVSNLACKSATLNANVTDAGFPATVTGRGFYWGPASHPTTGGAAGSGTGAYSLNITGLNPSTTYWIFSYAGNATGTFYSAQNTFTTPACPTHTVTFNGNGSTGGSTATQTFTEGETKNLNANGFTRTGYTFAGWATSSTGSVVYANQASYTMGTSNVTLYAKWTANAVMSGTINANNCTIAAGGNSCSSSLSWSTTNPVGTSAVTTPTNITVKTANTSTATYTVAYGTRTFYLYNNGTLLDQDPATASCTSGTSWNGSSCQTNVVTHTVTFNGNGSTGGSTATQTFTEGETKNLNANGFTRTGYTFAGWATTSTGSVVYANQASYTMGTSNVTLYAKWTANAVMSGTINANNCTIAAGGNSCSSSLSWSTTNPVGTSAVTTPTNITVKTANTSTATYTVAYGTRTFYLYNNGTLLDQDPATASCTSGTTWNGSVCQTNVAPVVTLTANPDSGTAGVVNPTLTWTVSGTATSCTASSLESNWSGSKTVGGSQIMGVLNTPKTYTYNLYCSNGSVNSPIVTETIYVTLPAKILSFTANPDEVKYNGITSLAWSSEDAPATCNLSGGEFSSDPVPNNSTGYSAGPLKETTTFTLQCGDAQAEVIVVVLPPDPIFDEN